jgi:hypothetical protein
MRLMRRVVKLEAAGYCRTCGQRLSGINPTSATLSRIGADLLPTHGRDAPCP